MCGEMEEIPSIEMRFLDCQVTQNCMKKKGMSCNKGRGDGGKSSELKKNGLCSPQQLAGVGGPQQLAGCSVVHCA